MPTKYVINPKTGRRVLADGPTGRKILKARRAKRARANKIRSCYTVCARKPATRRYTTRRRRPATRRYPRRNTQSYQRRLDDIDTFDYTSMSDVYGLDIL